MEVLASAASRSLPWLPLWFQDGGSAKAWTRLAREVAKHTLRRAGKPL